MTPKIQFQLFSHGMRLQPYRAAWAVEYCAQSQVWLHPQLQGTSRASHSQTCSFQVLHPRPSEPS